MAKENEVTFYTDFDKTMVDQNSPIHFLGGLIRRRPFSTLSAGVAAYKKYGLGGIGFLKTISSATHAERVKIVQRIVPKLTLKNRWLAELELFIRKHPNIMNIKFIVITRNISMFPELFLARSDIIAKLQAITGGRFKDDIVIIGNRTLASGLSFDSGAGKVSMLTIINNSSDKVPFIRKSNAFYFGDDEEYEELAHHPKLRKLHFIRV